MTISKKYLIRFAVLFLVFAFGVSMVDACDCSANVTGSKAVSGTFTEGGTVVYTIVLTKDGAYTQNDNPGNEFTDVLPASLILNSANATSGTAIANIITNTVTWNGSLGTSGSVTISITAVVQVGTAGQTISNQAVIAYDSDDNDTNDASNFTDDPNTITPFDATSFVVANPGSPSLPAVALPAPPASPLCMDQNLEDGVVRAGISDALAYGINCRVLYQNGGPAEWLGNALYNSASIGIPGIVELGIVQAVDIFSPTGMTYFNNGAVFCLKGEGTLIWIAASGESHHAEIIGSYTVPEFPGFTCATLFEPGTLVLVAKTPAQ